MPCMGPWPGHPAGWRASRSSRAYVHHTSSMAPADHAEPGPSRAAWPPAARHSCTDASFRSSTRFALATVVPTPQYAPPGHHQHHHGVVPSLARPTGRPGALRTTEVTCSWRSFSSFPRAFGTSQLYRDCQYSLSTNTGMHSACIR